MKKWIGNLRLRSKLILIFVLFSFIPLIIIILYSSNSSIFAMTDLAASYATEQFEKTNEEIREEVLKTSMALLEKRYEPAFMEALIGSVDAENPELHTEGKIVEELEQLIEEHEMFDSIYLYADTGDIFTSQVLDQFDDSYRPLQSQWFLEATESEDAVVFVRAHYDFQGQVKSKRVFSYVVNIRKKLEDRVFVATMVCNVAESEWMKKYYGKPYGEDVLVTDQNGEKIFTMNNRLRVDNASVLFQPEVTYAHSGYSFDEIEGVNYLVVWDESALPNTKVIKIESQEGLEKKIFQMRTGGILIALIAGAISIIALLLLSNSIIRPINRLRISIAKAQEGKPDHSQKVFHKDEVGELSRHYYIMMDKIHDLIEQLELNHRQSLELETRLLQAQVNPHFLYNTLNTIRSLAIIQGNKTIAKAVKSLSELLRSSIRIGQNYITIGEELKQIQNYVEIQMMRYTDKFRVEYDYDSEVTRYYTMKFLLQPIVENAIFHGLESVEKDGLIKISIQKEENEIFYRVSDNGPGMTEERLEEVRESLAAEPFSLDADHIGLKNVSDRIKVFFKEENSIRLSSIQGRGTTVVIVIPAILDQKELKND